MRKAIAVLLLAAMLSGCGGQKAEQITAPVQTTAPTQTAAPIQTTTPAAAATETTGNAGGETVSAQQPPETEATLPTETYILPENMTDIG